MKQITSKIVILLMAFVIFMTGMGTTIIHFCCNDCVEQFFSEVDNRITTPDCDVHENTTCCGHVEDISTTSSCDDSSTHTEKGCCKAERYSILLDSYHFKPVVFTPFVWIKSVLSDYSYSLTTNTIVEHLTYSTIEDPPNIFDNRTYLAFIRVLII